MCHRPVSAVQGPAPGAVGKVAVGDELGACVLGDGSRGDRGNDTVALWPLGQVGTHPPLPGAGLEIGHHHLLLVVHLVDAGGGRSHGVRGVEDPWVVAVPLRALQVQDQVVDRGICGVGGGGHIVPGQGWIHVTSWRATNSSTPEAGSETTHARSGR